MIITKTVAIAAIIVIGCIISLAIIIFSLVSVFSINVVTGIGCQFSIQTDLVQEHPLLLVPGGGYGNDAFFLPDVNRIVTLGSNQNIQLSCPGGNLVLNGTYREDTVARCTHFNLVTAGLQLPVRLASCTVYPDHVARHTGNTCLSQYTEIEIGFWVDNRFLRHILICFDEHNQNTLYSQFNLTRAIGGRRIGQPRPEWTEGEFFNLDDNTVNQLYSRQRQRATINGLLGLNAYYTGYISNDIYLSRGHLTAMADFVYGAQQRLTFYYVNAAPQWQPFNGANWNQLEIDTRDFATSRGLDLIVYTGTYGVTTLPHDITNQDIGLYLYVNDTSRAIPVPRLFWKVLYEPIRREGVVFLGVNNPHVFDENKDIICTDICDQYPWLSWQATNITAGYSYCCDVADFRRTVSTLPNFEVVNLLK
ncbi:hypothetical protein Trydic_g23669 [Trypoxylus dichotomus]